MNVCKCECIYGSVSRDFYGRPDSKGRIRSVAPLDSNGATTLISDEIDPPVRSVLRLIPSKH